MQYYGTRLSENISRREPEGYLLCLNVPVARTGTQEYLPRELGLPPARGDPLIPVIRPPEEVFSPATIASFEGMPVTNDHPPEGVSLENIRYLAKGHVHNVRRGTGDASDLLLADLIIQDRTLIDAILKDGKREISCGYLYELREENGQYVQRNIRGNHVAVVDAGRAGPRVRICDRKPSGSLIRRMASVRKLPGRTNDSEVRPGNSGRTERPKTERSLRNMKKNLYKKLVRMARDGDAEAIEAVAEIVENLTEELPSAAEPETLVVGYPPEPPAETPAAEPETPALTADSDLGAAILEKLDQLIALLTPAAADEADPAQEIAEAVAEAVEAGAAAEAPDEAAEIAEIMEEVLEPSTVLEPENTSDEAGETDPLAADALRAALKAVRPAISRMPKEQRRQVCGEIARRLRRTAGDSRQPSAGAYAALARAGRKSPNADPAELGRRIMASRNINCRV